MPVVPEAKRKGRFLVVGADGRIGRELLSALQAEGADAMGTCQYPPPPPGCVLLELADDPAGWEMPDDVAAAWLCAAISSQDACRNDPAGTRRINVDRTVALAGRLVARGAFVVFLSSSLVYDGTAPRRRASDPVCPATEYGRQKAEAERQLLALGENVAVVRMTKVLAADAPLLARWSAALQRGETIHPFSDMVFAPIALPHAVQALLAIAKRRRGGIYQVSADRDITYADAARRLATRLGAPAARVEPMAAARAGITPESIPSHTTLDASRVDAEFGLGPPCVWDAIDWAFGFTARMECADGFA